MNYTIDVVALVFIQKEKILLTRSKGSSLWYLPGGKRIAGESDTQTLLREIKEEISVDLRPESIYYLETIEAQAANEPVGRLVNMKCYSAIIDGELKVGREIAEFGFFDSSISNNAAPAVKLILVKLNKIGIIS